MAAYCWVYDQRHLRDICTSPTAPRTMDVPRHSCKSVALYSTILVFACVCVRMCVNAAFQFPFKHSVKPLNRDYSVPGDVGLIVRRIRGSTEHNFQHNFQTTSNVHNRQNWVSLQASITTSPVSSVASMYYRPSSVYTEHHFWGKKLTKF